MSKILKHDTDGTKPLLQKGEFGYDDYSAGGDEGRVWIGTGVKNIPLADKDSTSTTKIEVSQTAHGLALLDVVRLDGSGNYVKAQANTKNTLAVAIVVNVVDDDTIVVSQNGYHNVQAHGLTVGSTYYLSGTTSGSLSTTEGNISQTVLYPVDANNILISIGSSARANSSVVYVNQIAHGFTAGNVIYHNGTNYVTAQSDSDATLAMAVVSSVVDVDNFGISAFGVTEIPSHGFTVGEEYYLSDTIAGGVTTTEPSLSQPIFKVIDTNTIFINIDRPMVPYDDTDVAKKNELSNFTSGLQSGGTNVVVTTDLTPYARMAIDQVWSGIQKGKLTTDNDLSFDLSVSSSFKCTPTASGTLTFTNINSVSSGDSLLGTIWLDNSGGHVISSDSAVLISSSDLSAISSAGIYCLSLSCDGTNVQVVASSALTSGGV